MRVLDIRGQSETLVRPFVIEATGVCSLTQLPPTPEADVATKERVVSLLDRLTPKQREVVMMRFAEGVPTNVIAEYLGISRCGVNMLILRARQRAILPRLRSCGTRAAFQRHKARGEAPCDACVDANLAYFRNRRTGERDRLRA